MEKLPIKYVALYMRKSRGESEADLIKQKTLLTEMCAKSNWAYVEYCEVESGESLVMRPVMQRLLKDVENNMFDAVLVVDYDRLGRGDLGDQDRIKKSFVKSSTFVIDEKKIYDLENETDDLLVDLRGIFARQEYKLIVKRLTRGKRMGSKLGNWTNGIPPFPYEYQQWKDRSNPKGLVVNEEKLAIYNLIKEMFLGQRKVVKDISVELNKMGIPAPRGGLWSGVGLQRLLLDETHLGHIVSNKTKGDGHRVKKPSAKPLQKIPKEEWIRVENCHEAVKNLQEHEAIQALFFQRKLGISRKVIPIHALSGIVKCALCGRTMTFDKRADRPGHGLKPCWYVSPFGDKCSNRGGPVGIIVEQIEKEMAQFEAALRSQLGQCKDDTSQLAKSKIAEMAKKIEQVESKINFIYEQYENQVYPESVFSARRAKADEELKGLQEALQAWQLQLKVDSRKTDEDRLRRLEAFRVGLPNAVSSEALNDLYRGVLESVTWQRKGNEEISLKINFL